MAGTAACWVLGAIGTIGTGYELMSTVLKYQRLSDRPLNRM